MKNKKAFELHWVCSFQNKFAECPRSTPVASESPDFLFSDNDLGIEVVEFIRGQDRDGAICREREAVRSRIIQEAQMFFEVQQKQALWVMVFWRNAELPKRTEQKRLSQEIHRLIVSQVSGEGSSWHIKAQHLGTPLLEKHLFGIDIRKLKNARKGCWKWPDAGFIGKNVDAIQGLLNSKNVKVTDYRKACKTIWLLIVASTGRVSSKLHPSDPLADVKFEAAFDRVFIYDAFNESVEELQIAR